MQGTYEAKALWRSHARSLMLETKQKLVAASLRRVYLRQALALKPGSPLVLSPKWWDYRYASTGPVSRTFCMKGFSGWSLAAGYMDMKCITTQGMWELVPSLSVSLDQGDSNAQHFSFVCVRAYMHVHVCASRHACACVCVRPEVNLWFISQDSFPYSYLRRALIWTWDLRIMQSWAVCHWAPEILLAPLPVGSYKREQLTPSFPSLLRSTLRTKASSRP